MTSTRSYYLAIPRAAPESASFWHTSEGAMLKNGEVKQLQDNAPNSCLRGPAILKKNNIYIYMSTIGANELGDNLGTQPAEHGLAAKVHAKNKLSNAKGLLLLLRIILQEACQSIAVVAARSSEPELT